MPGVLQRVTAVFTKRVPVNALISADHATVLRADGPSYLLEAVAVVVAIVGEQRFQSAQYGAERDRDGENAFRECCPSRGPVYAILRLLQQGILSLAQ